MSEENTTICPHCHQIIHIGEYPFCPHGFGSGTSFKDEIPCGMVLENYGPDPVTVYSHSERKALLNRVQYDKTGIPYTLQETERYAPLPGTDRDPSGIPNPNGYRDLSAAAIIARNGRSTTNETEAYDPDDIPNEPGASDPHLIFINEIWEGQKHDR